MCLAVVTTYLGLGSNMGDRKAHLAHAIAALDSAGRVAGVSGIYETAPQGYVDQPAFLNMVPLLELEPGLVDPETGRPFATPEAHHGVRRIMSGEELLDGSSR